MEIVQNITQDVSCHYLSSLHVSTLCVHSFEAETRFPEVRGAFVYLRHKTGTGGPRVLGFQT